MNASDRLENHLRCAPELLGFTLNPHQEDELRRLLDEPTLPGELTMCACTGCVLQVAVDRAWLNHGAEWQQPDLLPPAHTRAQETQCNCVGNPQTPADQKGTSHMSDHTITTIEDATTTVEQFLAGLASPIELLFHADQLEAFANETGSPSFRLRALYLRRAAAYCRAAAARTELVQAGVDDDPKYDALAALDDLRLSLRADLGVGGAEKSGGAGPR